jgi:hypothetical protein
VAIGKFRADCTLGNQFAKQRWPFLTKDIGTRQAAIATNHHQAIDGMTQQVVGRLQSPLVCPEGCTTRRTDYCATTMQYSANIIPVQLPQQITTIDHALVAFVNAIHLDTAIQCGANNSANSSVHARRIATARQNANPFCSIYRHL